LEQAVLTASRKKYGHQGEIEVHYNEEAGEVELFQFKQVWKGNQSSTEISLREAKDLDNEAQIGDSLGVKLNTDFVALEPKRRNRSSSKKCEMQNGRMSIMNLKIVKEI